MSSNIQGGANTGRTTTVRPGGRGSETKHSLRTTELPIYVLAVMGLLIASAVADAQDFGTQEAWKYITWLTVGYLLSRGLAKSGSREFDDDDDPAVTRR